MNINKAMKEVYKESQVKKEMGKTYRKTKKTK